MVDVVVSTGPQRPPTPNAEGATQTIGSTAPASTAPASAAPVLTADEEGEFEHEGEIEGEFGDDDSSGPGGSGHGSPGRH